MLFGIILLALVIVLICFYLNGRYNETYWKKRGVKIYAKNKVFGPFWEFILGGRPLFEIYGDLYKEYEGEPVVGIGSFLTPSLFVGDADNISYILEMDFNAFNGRGVRIQDDDQLAQGINFLSGPKWKLIRQNMTPLFTSTKLKQMYSIMDKGAQDFVEYIKKDPARQRGNAYDSATNYCSAAITASVFGVGSKSIFESPFVEVARQAFKPTLSLNLKFALLNFNPWLSRILSLKLFTDYENYFIGLIKQVIEKREKENVSRHDFVDIAVRLQKNGMMKDEVTGYEVEPTVGLLSAQAFLFFIAGVEPSATTIFCTLVELGVNPDILQKVHREIDETFDRNNNVISFDVISDMNYLEKVLSEAMRMYPPVAFLLRQCSQDTVLPVGNIRVSKGTKIVTPVFDIHRDPKYYPEPDKFNPDRFTRDGQQLLSGTFYMPFGRGGRRCIGSRLARVQIKAGLVHLLRHFTVKTINYEKLEFRKEPISVRPLNVDVQFIPRKIKSNKVH